MQDVSTFFDDAELNSDEQVDVENSDSDATDREESDGEEQPKETTAMMLSDEVSHTIVVAVRLTIKLKVPSLVSNGDIKLKQRGGKSQSARDRKQVAEVNRQCCQHLSTKLTDLGFNVQIPTWRDVDDAVSESMDDTTCGESEPYSSDIEASAAQPATNTSSLASLVRTEKGNVKLLDQNQQTRRVVWDAIIDAKCYIIFVDAYPELVDKNQVSVQSLLTVAKNHGMHSIVQRLQKDNLYASQLASLVSPLQCASHNMSNYYLRWSHAFHYCAMS